MGDCRLPLWAKMAFSGFMLVLVPVYWRDYGPTNFLYFCDLALFFTLAAVWLDSPLLASAPLVGILLPQLAWQVDFLSGGHILGMTSYMFDPRIPFFTRALSFFHFWLPLFLLWMVWRLGYHGRAVWLWTAVAVPVLFVCYFWMPAPGETTDPNQPVNINYVHGLSDREPQKWLPPDVWFALLVLGLPLLGFLPTHVALKWLFPRPAAARCAA